jgi:transposase, IS30 family
VGIWFTKSDSHLQNGTLAIQMGISLYNSPKRKKLNNRSPYETFSFYHGEEVLHKLGCSKVAANDIMLKPALLKK